MNRIILFLSVLSLPLHAQEITEIIDRFGDGTQNEMRSPVSVAVDMFGNAYVIATGSDNVFKVYEDGAIVEIADSTGAGGGDTLYNPTGLAVDPFGVVYVASADSSYDTSLFFSAVFKIPLFSGISELADSFTVDSTGNWLSKARIQINAVTGTVFIIGHTSGNVFTVSPQGELTELLNRNSLGFGYSLSSIGSVAIDTSDNLYLLTGDNLFKIAPDGTPSLLLDDSGDGAGNILRSTSHLVRDGAGTLYVAGLVSDNVFAISPHGEVREIIDSSGDGVTPLNGPHRLAVDTSLNVYVASQGYAANLFRVSPDGAITHLFSYQDSPGFIFVRGMVPDALGNVYIWTDNAVWKVNAGGVVGKIIDESGDGKGNTLSDIADVAVDDAGNVYVVGESSHNVFKITYAEVRDGRAWFEGGVLTIPVVRLGTEYYRLRLLLSNEETLDFSVLDYGILATPNPYGASVFENNVICVPAIEVGEVQYRAEITIKNTNPITVRITQVKEL